MDSLAESSQQAEETGTKEIEFSEFNQLTRVGKPEIQSQAICPQNLFFTRLLIVLCLWRYVFTNI